MDSGTQDTATRRAVLMSSIGMALAGCSSRASTPTESQTETRSPTPTETPTGTPSATESPESDDTVPFSETDRVGELAETVEELGTTVYDARTVGNGVSLFYDRTNAGKDLCNVALGWLITYYDVRGYSLFTATGMNDEEDRHGLFSINEEQVLNVINRETTAEEFYADLFGNYEARWADS